MRNRKRFPIDLKSLFTCIARSSNATSCWGTSPRTEMKPMAEMQFGECADALAVNVLLRTYELKSQLIGRTRS
jgi:hypothetical protein